MHIQPLGHCLQTLPINLICIFFHEITPIEQMTYHNSFSRKVSRRMAQHKECVKIG